MSSEWFLRLGFRIIFWVHLSAHIPSFYRRYNFLVTIITFLIIKFSIVFHYFLFLGVKKCSTENPSLHSPSIYVHIIRMGVYNIRLNKVSKSSKNPSSYLYQEPWNVFVVPAVRRVGRVQSLDYQIIVFYFIYCKALAENFPASTVENQKRAPKTFAHRIENLKQFLPNTDLFRRRL